LGLIPIDSSVPSPTMEFYTNKALDPHRKKRYTRAELQDYSVFRSNLNNEVGMKIERRIAQDGSKSFFIESISNDGLVARNIPQLEVGDRIIELNGMEMDEFPGLYQVNELLKKEKEITISLLKEEKQKQWMHAPKRDYAGQLDKPEKEDEGFRPASKTYPKPRPKSKVPAIFKRNGVGRPKSKSPTPADIASGLANASIETRPKTAAAPKSISYSGRTVGYVGQAERDPSLSYHPADEPGKLSRPAAGTNAKSSKGWAPVAKEHYKHEVKKKAQIRTEIQDEWDEFGNLTRTTIKHIIEPGWTNQKKIKSVETIPASEAAQYRNN